MWPVWEVQGHGSGSPPAFGGAGLPPWFCVRLTFADGARVDVLAVVGDGRMQIEDLRAEPPLPLEAFGALTEWITEPLRDACRAVAERQGVPLLPFAAGLDPGSVRGAPAPSRHRAPRTRTRRRTARRAAAAAYRAAQEEGSDPVIAVMGATGRSRRKSLRLIAAAREAGFLAPRHVRR